MISWQRQRRESVQKVPFSFLTAEASQDEDLSKASVGMSDGRAATHRSVANIIGVYQIFERISIPVADKPLRWTFMAEIERS